MLVKLIYKSAFFVFLIMQINNLYAEERLVSVGSAITELLYALQADKNLVAVDITSVLPSNITLPRVGYHRQLSAEGILNLSATRVLGSKVMGPSSTLKLLRESGVAVDVINSDATIKGLLTRVDELAKITHTQKNSVRLKKKIRDLVNKLEKNPIALAQKKKVLFLIMRKGRLAMVAGKNTSIDEIITLAGGINPASKSINAYKPLSMESMLNFSPDVVVFSGRNLETPETIDEMLDALPMLALTPAGINRALFAIDARALMGGLGLYSLDEAMRLHQFLYK